MLRIPLFISEEFSPASDLLPNGVRYPLVGGTRQRHFDGTSFKPQKWLENAQIQESCCTLCWAFFVAPGSLTENPNHC